jgi:small conductance mechanosensitive channel
VYGWRLATGAVDYLPNLARALIVLLVFFALFRVLAGVFRRLLRRTRADPSIVGISTRLVKYVLVVFALVMAASELGFNVGSLLAGIGIVGLALGLAAQESLGNVVAGLTILWDRPYRVGDNVTIAGTFGRVQEIGLRTTRILTVERLDAILPNREIVKEMIVNHTSNPQLRLGVQVSIAYREDTREARRVLLAAVKGNRLILDDPPPAVVVTALAESGVNLELRTWLRDAHEEREALFELTEVAKLALDEAGIEIPFPQRTLHFAGGEAPARPGGEAGEAGGADRVLD